MQSENRSCKQADDVQLKSQSATYRRCCSVLEDYLRYKGFDVGLNLIIRTTGESLLNLNLERGIQGLMSVVPLK